MRVAVCTGNPHKESVEVLAEQLALGGHSLDIWTRPEHVDPRVDGFIFRGAGSPPELREAERASMVAQSMAVPCLNGYFPRLCRDKAATHWLWGQAGLPQPAWQMPSPEARPHFSSEWFVVKPCRGSEGEGVERFSTWQEALRHTLDSDEDCFIQEFIPGVAVRVLASPRSVLAAYAKLPPPGDWVAAVSLGGSRAAFELSPQQSELCLRAVEVLQSDFLGLDLLVSDSHTLLLEANAAADLPREIIEPLDNGAVLEALLSPFGYRA